MAAVKRDFIWIQFFVSVLVFLQFFDEFHCLSYHCLKPFPRDYRKLILKFVGDEKDLHHEYGLAKICILCLWLIDKDLVLF